MMNIFSCSWNWILRLYYFWVFYHKVLYNVEYNLYMILKMMCWLSFCLYFFITNFTIMVNDFELGVFCWDLIMLFFWCKFTMLKVIIMILKMVHVFGICFCFLVTKFTIIIILVWDSMMNIASMFLKMVSCTGVCFGSPVTKCTMTKKASFSLY